MHQHCIPLERETNDPTWLQGRVEIAEGGSAQLMKVGRLFKFSGWIEGFLPKKKVN